MALPEPVRASIFHKFEDLLGTEDATAFLEDYRDVNDLITRDQLDGRLRETEMRMQAGFAEVRVEIADLRTEVPTEAAGLHDRIDALGSRLDGRMDSLTSRLDGRIDSLTSRVEGGFEALGGRMEGLDGRMDALSESLNGRMSAQSEGLKGRMDGIEARIEAIAPTVVKQLLFWLVPLLFTAMTFTVVVSRLGT